MCLLWEQVCRRYDAGGCGFCLSEYVGTQIQRRVSVARLKALGRNKRANFSI